MHRKILGLIIWLSPSIKILDHIHQSIEHTVEVAGIFFIWEVGDKLCFLPQQPIPIEALEEDVLFDFEHPSRTKSINGIVVEQANDDVLGIIWRTVLLFIRPVHPLWNNQSWQSWQSEQTFIANRDDKTHLRFIARIKNNYNRLFVWALISYEYSFDLQWIIIVVKSILVRWCLYTRL